MDEQGYSVPETGERLGVPTANITRWVQQYHQGKLVPGALTQQSWLFMPKRF